MSGLDRTFSYRTGDPPPPVGTIVRVPLHGRRVRGWVVATDPGDEGGPPGEVELHPVDTVVSAGPPPAVVDVCRWAAWRFSGPLRPFLAAASPRRAVASLSAAEKADLEQTGLPRPPPLAGDHVGRAVAEAVALGDSVLRLPPSCERQPVVEAALAAVGELKGAALVLVESRDDAERLAARLRRAGRPVAAYPAEWAEARRSGRVVVGTRNAALAPLEPSLTVVLDAHSESYRSERVPTFDARLIAAERARRAGTPALFVSPCPPLELLTAEGRSLVTLPRRAERAGWGSIAVLDAREEDPADRGYPSRLVSLIRRAVSEAAQPVVCVLNRKGRARLLSCGSCRSVQRCTECGAALSEGEPPAPGLPAALACARCGSSRTALCSACGSSRLRVLRAGVARAREELEAVTGLPVRELGAREGYDEQPGCSGLVIGTVAALFRLRRAAMVVWLDFDQQLLAPRFRAAEEALSLLARSLRMVSFAEPRASSGPARVVVRTTMPEHEVLRAARLGDPALVTAEEGKRRAFLGLPPYSSLARLDGEGAAQLAGRLSEPLDVAAMGGDSFVVKAPSGEELAAGLAGLVASEPGGVASLAARIEVEPVDL